MSLREKESNDRPVHASSNYNKTNASIIKGKTNVSCSNKKTADTVDTDQFLKAPSSFIIRVVWSYLLYE